MAIPSALKWLLTRRARLMGEKRKLEAKLPGLIQRIEQEVAQAQQRLDNCQTRLMIAKQHGHTRIQLIEQDLAALDNTIRLHDIDIDPELLRPIATQESGRLLAHGELTGLILQILKNAGGASVTTTEMTLLVAQHAGLAILAEDLPNLRLSVRTRLKTLVSSGDVRRVHTATTKTEGRWAAKATHATTQRPWAAVCDAASTPAILLSDHV